MLRFLLYKNTGLLLLRVGIGSMFMYHGKDKMFGGPEEWEDLGKQMSYVGISFLPVFWGFMASFAEFFGGLLLIIGFYFRPACILLFLTMFVAAAFHLGRGDGLGGASHAVEAGIVFLGLIFIGPGKYSFDKR
ncbi:MAG: DoxX family protein [Bacteroidetes bacterium]|nr:DoxX family protein [Bacteroidota bacterium]